MPRPRINSEEVIAKGHSRVLYTNTSMEQDIYCPACDLFFDDLDHYHLHIAQREMERVVERATERVNETIRNCIYSRIRLNQLSNDDFYFDVTSTMYEKLLQL